MRAVLSFLFVLVAPSACNIEPPDYEEFNIGCRADDASTCPKDFFCNGTRCQRLDGGGGGVGGGDDVNAGGGPGGLGGDSGGGAGGSGDGGDCPSDGFLASCAGEYNFAITIGDQTGSSPVEVCGNGSIGSDGTYAAGAIRSNGDVSYLDLETGFLLVGKFRQVVCNGSGEWTIVGNPDAEGGRWLLTRAGGGF